MNVLTDPWFWFGFLNGVLVFLIIARVLRLLFASNSDDSAES